MMYLVWLDERVQCGGSTDLVDANGVRLSIGDIVTVDELGDSFVFADEDGPFVMGILCASKKKAFGKHIVVLKTKHSDVPVGTVVGDGRYVGPPSLRSGSEDMGSCGVLTDLVDRKGTRLSIGDQVVVISPDTRTVSVSVVVSPNEPYISGIKAVCDRADYGGWHVVKWKGFEDTVVGEKCGWVTYV